MSAIATKKTKALALSKLNSQNKQFCLALLELNFNGTRAYKAAYPNCTDETARRNANKLLTNTDIIEFIDNEIKERNQRLRLSADRVVFELMQIAFSDLADFGSWDSNGLEFKSSGTLEPEKRRVVKRVKFTRKSGVTEQTTLEIERDDRMKALELLGRHAGMWKEQPKEDNVFSDFVDALKKVKPS